MTSEAEESSTIQSDEKIPENILKIMIATDNHLGYGEKDPIRGNDSFLAFEEILQHAEANEVDFILLGGDLFHDATPSQNSIYKCMNLLRRYTLGSRAISLEFLSDQNVNFVDCFNSTVNYEDPNLNVAIPVFSIHGNHDDPSGYGLLSTLDLLATSGLVNYFGKWTDLTKLEIHPILLRKGCTQLALFGLSHIHDSRLVRLFADSKVIMKKPDESTGSWFNLMVLHQNRANRGPKNHLPEDVLPDFIDLVIWGHEHDCRITPEQNVKHKFHVSQPGSSVPTSLSEGESIPKHCGILHIYKDEFRMNNIPLKTVRPFIFRSVDLQAYMDENHTDYHLDDNLENNVMAVARTNIEEMILKAESKRTDHPLQPALPLIRLRLVYENESLMFNAIRFGQEFNTRIANPNEVVHFKKIIKRAEGKGGVKDMDANALRAMLEKEAASTLNTVEDVVDQYFEEAEDDKKLQIMSSRILGELTSRIVNRNDTNAADNIISYFKENALEQLLDKLPKDDETDGEILKIRDQSNDMYQAILKKLDERGSVPTSRSEIDVRNDENSSISSISTFKNNLTTAKTSTQAATRGKTTRGRGRGRGAAKTADTTVTGRGKKPTIFEQLGTASKTSSRASERNKSSVVYELSSDSE